MPRKPAKPALFTKEQRDAIARELSAPYGMVGLVADGHLLLARVERFKGLRWVVIVYVDGMLKGEYYKADNEIGAKYWRAETSCWFSRKVLATYAKTWGKREAKRLQKKCTATVHMPYFPSAGAWLTKLQRTVATIDALAVGYTACKAAQEARDAAPSA